MTPRSLHADTRAMRRVAAALLRDPDVAEDVVQDAWVAALSSPVERPGRSWLTTVVRRLSWAQRSERRPEPLATEPADEQAGGARSAAAAELAAAVHALPQHYREVLERRYWEDEPPRVIARHLGLDVKTVSNRLHRAHVALRRSLERDDGSSTRSARALLITLARPEEPTAHTAALAMTAASPKLLVPVVFAAALAVFLARTAGGPDGPGALSPADTASSPSEERVARGPGPELPVPETVRVERGRVDVAPGSAGGVSPEELPGALHLVEGEQRNVRLVLDVRDSTSGDPIEDFIVAFRADEGESSLRTTPVGVGLDVMLPPRTAQDLVLQARGYDDLDLGRVDVGDGPTLDLGTVHLDRGAAVLQGQVVVPSNVDLDLLVVTVTGVGRWQCMDCPDHRRAIEHRKRCQTCGFDGLETMLALAGTDGSFRVDQLVAGPVRIVLSDHATGDLLASRVVVLARGGATDVVLEVGTKDVVVALEDADGRAFDGVWMEDAELFRAPLTFQLWSGDIVSGIGTVEPGDFGRDVAFGLGAETILRTERDLLGPDAESVGATGRGALLEALWPDALPLPKGVRPKKVTVQRIEDGLYRVSGAPASVDAVQVACGPFVESAVPFASEPGEPEKAHLVVQTRCGIEARAILSVEDVSCTSCHQVQ